MANRVVDDWVVVPEADDWVDVPDTPTPAVPQDIRQSFGAIGAGMGGFVPTPETRQDLAAGIKEAPAALAAGTEQMLGTIGKGLQFKGEQMQDPVHRMLMKAAPGPALVQFIADRIGLPEKLKESGKYISEYWDEQASTGWEAPDPELMEAKWNMPVRYATRVTMESAPTFAAAIGAGYVSGNPNVALTLMGAFEKLNSFSKQIEGGASFQKANIISNLSGAWEAITEKIPFDYILKGGVGSRLTKAVTAGGLEGVQELLAGMGQNFLEYFGYEAKDWASIPGAIKEGLVHTFDNWLESVVAGTLLGGGAGAVMGSRTGPAVAEGRPPAPEIAQEGVVAPVEAGVGVPGAVAPEVAEGKQPWEMSREEFISQRNDKTKQLENDVFYINGVEVIQNPTSSDMRQLNKEVKERFPGIKDATTRFTEDDYGNKFVWAADKAIHSQIDPEIAKKIGREVNQNADFNFSKTNHKRIIYNAVKEGKPVPAEVLAEYPDLAKPQAPEKGKATQPKLTPRQAQILGHSLPKKLGWSEAQRRDFMVETIGKNSMKGMTPKEAQTLVAALQEQARDQGLLPPEDYPKTIFIGGREVDTAEFIDESVATVGKLKDRAAKQPKMRPHKQAKPTRKISHIVKAALTGIDNLSIPHLMRQIGAAAEGVFKEVGVTNWRRSQHRIASTFRGGVDMLNDALDKAGVTHKDLARMSSAADPRLELLKRGREVLGRGKTKHYTVKINDKQFSLSMDELMDMYLASLQNKGPGHIETGGFEVRGYKTGPIDEAKMDELRAIVEADEGAMAAMNAAIKIADEYNAPQLNYTNGRLNPETMEDIADRTNYWHLEPKQPKKIKGKQTYNISLLENKNILKPRTGGKQPLVIRGFFPRFFTVQYAVSEYVGMAEELRLMNMILNNDAIIEGLEAKGYTEVRDNLKQLLEWVQSRGSATTSTDKLLGKILHGAYRAVLHYSPEVIMSQYMSTGHYAGIVDPKYAKLLTTPPTPKLVKEMLTNNPVVWQRYYAGGQSAELAELGQLDVTLRLLSGKHADLNKTGIAAQTTDLAAFAQGWKIAKTITKDTGVKEGTPEYWDAVNDQAEQLWDTQPSWDKWNKSINTSQRGVKKALFLFRSYYEKSLMMLHSANATYEQSGKTAKDRAKQAQVYGAVLGSQVATALMRTFIGWAVWRKRKDVWDYLAAMAAAPFGMMSLVGGYMGRVVGNMIRILGGSKQKFEGDPLSTLPGKTIEDFLLGLGQMGDASAHYLAGDEEKAGDQAKKATRNLIISVGTMRGVPVRQIDKIIKATEQEKISGGYTP